MTTESVYSLFLSPIFTNMAKEIIFHKIHYLLLLIFHEYYLFFSQFWSPPTTDNSVGTLRDRNVEKFRSTDARRVVEPRRVVYHGTPDVPGSVAHPRARSSPGRTDDALSTWRPFQRADGLFSFAAAVSKGSAEWPNMDRLGGGLPSSTSKRQTSSQLKWKSCPTRRRRRRVSPSMSAMRDRM